MMHLPVAMAANVRPGGALGRAGVQPRGMIHEEEQSEERRRRSSRRPSLGRG
jgi:hypothetical protein